MEDRAPKDGSEECLVFDEVRDRYFWFHIGWDGKRRVQGIMVYLRIRDGKIWVEEDWTKQGVANDLLEAGIPMRISFWDFNIQVSDR